MGLNAKQVKFLGDFIDALEQESLGQGANVQKQIEEEGWMIDPDEIDVQKLRHKIDSITGDVVGNQNQQPVISKLDLE